MATKAGVSRDGLGAWIGGYGLLSGEPQVVSCLRRNDGEVWLGETGLFRRKLVTVHPETSESPDEKQAKTGQLT